MPVQWNNNPFAATYNRKSVGTGLGIALWRSSAIVKLGRCRVSDTPPAWNENAVNFCERFLNVHVGQSDGGNYAIETPVGEWHSPAPCRKVRLGNRTLAATRQLPSMSRPVTSSEAATPHEARSRPGPQPKSRIRINRAFRLCQDSTVPCKRRHSYRLNCSWEASRRVEMAGFSFSTLGCRTPEYLHRAEPACTGDLQPSHDQAGRLENIR